ncbi:MAG: dTMP kinase [Acidimicrobiia bacterium]
MSVYVGLEGVDGSGKTSVAAAMATTLSAQDFEVVLVREPGGTGLGEEIRRLLLHSDDMVPWAEAALFAAQRAQLAAEVIAPALARGAWVISDRTYYSSLAYQGAARGLGIEPVRSLNETVLGGVLPDLVAVIDVDAEVGLRRQHGEDRIGGAGLAFQQAVSDAYHRLATADPERVVLVDPSGGIEDVAARVLALAASMTSQ